jgi:hypothetical protein
MQLKHFYLNTYWFGQIQWLKIAGWKYFVVYLEHIQSGERAKM